MHLIHNTFPRRFMQSSGIELVPTVPYYMHTCKVQSIYNYIHAIIIIKYIYVNDCQVFLNATALNSGVAGLSSNATLVVLVPRHHDVSLHSPVCAPAKLKGNSFSHNTYIFIHGSIPVFDKPVIFTILCTIANS